MRKALRVGELEEYMNKASVTVRLIANNKLKPGEAPSSPDPRVNEDVCTPELLHERATARQDKIGKDFQFNELNGVNLVPFENQLRR